MSRKGLRIQASGKDENALMDCTDRLRRRYLMFMWHVFREGFFSEIQKLDNEMTNHARSSGRSVNIL
jgi:hypothetical protein